MYSDLRSSSSPISTPASCSMAKPSVYSSLRAFEDLHHGVSDGVDHFVVMVAERHLNIQAHKLSQVTVSVGVLSPEN
ncbi:hypothetical protein EYF80_001051 [Liparis tanakae]|uniref:Uncharacterized protein n=1 Tax=Liparis tanakae TaxID=230148 RepID=A0A4Z2JEN7_9TELE|nr:hypothetical protein EYF80_001051 [Liparis tanakae]